MSCWCVIFVISRWSCLSGYLCLSISLQVAFNWSRPSIFDEESIEEVPLEQKISVKVSYPLIDFISVDHLIEKHEKTLVILSFFFFG